MSHCLVLGGIRSGKSELAEARLAAAFADDAARTVYVATATPGDAEMAARIRHHQARRPGHWELVEAPLRLAAVLEASAATGDSLLIDCMSLWMSNLLHAGEGVLDQERAAFLARLASYDGVVVVVSNEVGLGTIGMDPLTRHFCDELGRLNQALARHCDEVWLSVAGLALCLKGGPAAAC